MLQCAKMNGKGVFKIERAQERRENSQKRP
jgi:hypothetical protein